MQVIIQEQIAGRSAFRGSATLTGYVRQSNLELLIGSAVVPLCSSVTSIPWQTEVTGADEAQLRACTYSNAYARVTSQTDSGVVTNRYPCKIETYRDSGGELTARVTIRLPKETYFSPIFAINAPASTQHVVQPAKPTVTAKPASHRPSVTAASTERAAAIEARTEARSHIQWFGNCKGSFDPRWVWVGDARLPVLRKRVIEDEGSAEVGVRIREPSSRPGVAWKARKSLTLTVEYPVQLDGDPDYSALADLRRLIAAARVTPFLPIQWGDHASPTYAEVDAIVIQQIIVQTVQQFPGTYTVQIVAAPFNWSYLLKDPDKGCFADYFVWPIYTRYLDMYMQQSMPYRVHTGDVAISVADEGAYATLLALGLEHTIGALTDTKGTFSSRADRELQYVEQDRTMLREVKPLATSTKDLYAALGKALADGPVHCEIDDWSGTFTESYDGAYSGTAHTLPLVYFRISSRLVLSNVRLIKILGREVRWTCGPDDPYQLYAGGDAFVPGEIYAVPGERWAIVRSALDAILNSEKLKQGLAALKKTGGNPLRDPAYRIPVALPSMTVDNLTLVFTNIISELNCPGHSFPAYQFWGSSHVQVQFSISGDQGLGVVREAYDQSLRQRRMYSPLMSTPLGTDPGIWYVEERLLSALGMTYFQAQNVTVQDVDGVPGREEASVLLTLYIPKDEKLIQQLASKAPQRVGRNRSNSVDQLRTAQLEVEEYLDALPLYPDLYLPTYDTLTTWLGAESDLTYCRPLESKGSHYVDPDFYIRSTPQEDLLEMRSIVNNGPLNLTVSTRYKDKPPETIAPDGGTIPLASGSTVVEVSVGSRTIAEASVESPIVTDLNMATAASASGAAVGAMAGASAAPTDTASDESPSQYDVKPVPATDAVRGMFHDLLHQTPLNRLANAYPTFLLVLYREGLLVGARRLWDQFYGRIPVSEISIIESLDKPDGSAVITLSDPGSGLLTRDLEGTSPLDEWDYWNSPQKHGSVEAAYQELFRAIGQDLTEIARGTGPPGEPNAETIQRWRDQSNALIISAGTRVHIRAGYGSRAHLLPIGFNGTITEVEMQPDALSVIAASDGVELLADIDRRGDMSEESDGKPDKATIWEGVRPRPWILKVLGSYRSKSFTSMVYNLFHADKALATNEYGINHFGAPIPVATNSLCDALLNTAVGTPRGFTWSNVSELGQNIYGSRIPHALSEALYWDPAGDPLSPYFTGQVLEPSTASQRSWVDRNLSSIPTANEDGSWREGFEGKLTIDATGKTFWDIVRELARCIPGFVCAPRPFGVFRSTLFFGMPIFPLAYNYILPRRATDTEELTLVREMQNRDLRSAPLRGEIQLPGLLELCKTFSQVHMANDQWNLVANNIATDSTDVFTRVRLWGLNGDGSWNQTATLGGVTPQDQVLIYQVDADIYPEIQKEADIATPFRWKWLSGIYAKKMGEFYAQERLADSCRTMYDGAIVMLGNMNIRPWDGIQLTDTLTNTQGFCMVREVVHSLGPTTGFVTSITPGALAFGACASHNIRAYCGAYSLATQISTVMTAMGMEHKARISNTQRAVGLVNSAVECLAAIGGQGAYVRDASGRTTYDYAQLLRGTLRELSNLPTVKALVSSLNVAQVHVLAARTLISQHKDQMWTIKGTAAPIEQLDEELQRVARGLRGLFGYSLAGSTSPDEAALLHQLVLTELAKGRRVLNDNLRTTPLDQAEQHRMLKLPTASSFGFHAISILPTKLGESLQPTLDGVQIFLLSRAGRELEAGITGHRGSVVGEPGSGWEHVVRILLNLPILGKFLDGAENL